jgi:RHS repeat-associated protein
LLEFTGADVLAARYTHGDEIDRPLSFERNGQSHYYHADLLGSIRRVTSESGAVVNSYAYDAYGRFVQTSSDVVNPFAFTGREFDSESGLHYYRARYYSPETGRFLSPDPIGFLGNDLNLYRYVHNNPVNATDPTGMFEIVTCGVVAAGVFVFGSFVKQWNANRERREMNAKVAQEAAARTRRALEETDTEYLNNFTPEQQRDILDAERTARGACIVNAAELARTVPGTTFTGPAPNSVADAYGTLVQEGVFSSPTAKPPENKQE